MAIKKYNGYKKVQPCTFLRNEVYKLKKIDGYFFLLTQNIIQTNQAI